MSDGHPEKPLRINPGSLPEAVQLEALIGPLIEIRAVIVRESIGVDSPIRKLGAIDEVLKEQSSLIFRTIRAARVRHGGALAADDGIRLMYSIYLNVTLQADWLQSASSFRRLPSKEFKGEMSAAKTREERERRLNEIRGRTKVAREVIHDLKRVALLDVGVKNVNSSIEFLSSMEMRFRCNEIGALVITSDEVNKKNRLPTGTLRSLQSELIKMAGEHANESFLWHSLALVSNRLGDDQQVAESLSKQLSTVSERVEDRFHVLRDCLQFSKSDLDSLKFVTEIERLTTDEDLGAVFSRERIGRSSIISHALAWAAQRANLDELGGRELFQRCFSCHSRLHFGVDAPREPNSIKVVIDTSGHGRVAWLRNRTLVWHDFSIDPASVGQIVFIRESMSTNSSLWSRLVQEQNDALGPALGDAFTDIPDGKLEVIGLADDLPLSLVSVSGSPVGARESFGFLHPRAAALRANDESQNWHPDLLLVDRSFGKEATAVISTAKGAPGSVGIRVLEFDSSSSSDVIHSELIAALEESKSFVYFGHVASKLATASESGLLIGVQDVVSVQELAQLNLESVSGVALIACSSGRANPFIGPVSAAYALAVAGVHEVAFSYWPIRQNNGERFAKSLLENQMSLSDSISHSLDASDPYRGAFSIIRF